MSNKMSKTEFEARQAEIRRLSSYGHRSPRMSSPEQTTISTDREVYEFVRAHADRRRISLRSALTELLRPLMEGR